MDGSKWLNEIEVSTEVNKMIQEELKRSSELVLMALDRKTDEWEMTLQRGTLKKARRVTAWCLRFCKNAPLKKQREARKASPLKQKNW